MGARPPPALWSAQTEAAVMALTTNEPRPIHSRLRAGLATAKPAAARARGEVRVTGIMAGVLQFTCVLEHTERLAAGRADVTPKVYLRRRSREVLLSPDSLNASREHQQLAGRVATT